MFFWVGVFLMFLLFIFREVIFFIGLMVIDSDIFIWGWVMMLDDCRLMLLKLFFIWLMSL